MKEINLHKYYPFCNSGEAAEVPDEIAEVFLEIERHENAYRVRTYRYKAYYSLDRDDGIENDTVKKPLTPEEILNRKEDQDTLYRALDQLTEIQRRRIYAQYILGMKRREIAEAEGCDYSSVSESIQRGLKQLRKLLKNML